MIKKIVYIRDLLLKDGTFMSFNDMVKRYFLRTNFLQVEGIFNCIRSFFEKI